MHVPNNDSLPQYALQRTCTRRALHDRQDFTTHVGNEGPALSGAFGLFRSARSRSHRMIVVRSELEPRDDSEKECSEKKKASNPLHKANAGIAGNDLDSFLAGGQGFEPWLPGPEPGVLPLDDPPAHGIKVVLWTNAVKAYHAQDARQIRLKRFLQVASRRCPCKRVPTGFRPHSVLK